MKTKTAAIVPEKSPGKILTIRQPFAELIVRGEKLIENRPWKTDHRGLLWILAGAGDSGCSRDTFRKYPQMKFGGIIGAAWLVDCCPLRDLPTKHPALAERKDAIGPICWIMGTFARVDYFPLRGRQGIWTDSDVWENRGLQLPENWRP